MFILSGIYSHYEGHSSQILGIFKDKQDAEIYWNLWHAEELKKLEIIKAYDELKSKSTTNLTLPNYPQQVKPSKWTPGLPITQEMRDTRDQIKQQNEVLLEQYRKTFKDVHEKAAIAFKKVAESCGYGPLLDATGNLTIKASRHLEQNITEVQNVDKAFVSNPLVNTPIVRDIPITTPHKLWAAWLGVPANPAILDNLFKLEEKYGDCVKNPCTMNTLDLQKIVATLDHASLTSLKKYLTGKFVSLDEYLELDLARAVRIDATSSKATIPTLQEALTQAQVTMPGAENVYNTWSWRRAQRKQLPPVNPPPVNPLQSFEF